jgi:hypothetical protein
LTVSLLFELAALNFTVPATFESARPDRETLTTVPPTWMELLVSAMGISSAWAFPVLSVASATIPPALVTALPE